MKYKIAYINTDKIRIALGAFLIILGVMDMRGNDLSNLVLDMNNAHVDFKYILYIELLDISIWLILLYYLFTLLKLFHKGTILRRLGTMEANNNLNLELNDEYIKIISKNIVEIICFTDILTIDLNKDKLKLKIKTNTFEKSKYIYVKVFDKEKELHERILEKMNRNFI